ncbi:MAG: hypothetical protein M3296_08315, partial [Actinomycetota bacterium]|nr:hypothetical protein [Actinomycetota bacterium]
MSHDFLAVDRTQPFQGERPVARSPMERLARAAGARFAVRDDWNVAVAYADAEHEARAAAEAVAWADSSHLGKLELQARPDDLRSIVGRSIPGEELELGRSTRAADAWWCPLTAERVLVLCPPGPLPTLREELEQATRACAGRAGVVEVTTAYAALTIAGPGARELFARFTALDLRP